MNCAKPITIDGVTFPCGKCAICRRRQASIWRHRIILEALDHDNVAFVTLTYNDEHLPEYGVDPQETSGFFKRLRAAGHKVRYYAVGEYGGKTLRPHYHAIIFGLATCEYGQTRHFKTSAGKECCPNCTVVEKAWQKRGAIECATFTPNAAAYCAGYVAEKFVGQKLPSGTKPPFRRMSLRPGLGTGVIPEIADTLLRFELDQTLLDVPVTLQHGANLHLPLGRYLRQLLRQQIGREKTCPVEVLERMRLELVQTRKEAWDNGIALSKLLEEKMRGKNWSAEQKLLRKVRKSI